LTKSYSLKFFKFSRSFKNTWDFPLGPYDSPSPLHKITFGRYANRKERIWFAKFLQKNGVRGGCNETGDIWYFYKENTAVFNIVVCLIKDEELRKTAMAQFRKPTAKSTLRGLKRIIKVYKTLVWVAAL
jgi:hypothetical protein